MATSAKPKILIWDTESAGVGGLYANQSFMVCVGFKWKGEAKTRVISVLDYPGKHCQDDTQLLRAFYPIMVEADHIVAHYGDRHDRPYVESRFTKAGLKPFPLVRQTDTWRISKEKLKLSNNRLATMADFLEVPTRKMVKGDGYPKWWMGALRGDSTSIRSMAKYCAIDVQCLDECHTALMPLIPNKYLFNRAIGEKTWTCRSCGGHSKQDRGHYFSEGRLWKRVQCRAAGCGKWDYHGRPLGVMPK